jgi:RND family efflux transporter MFP subunit
MRQSGLALVALVAVVSALRVSGGGPGDPPGGQKADNVRFTRHGQIECPRVQVTAHTTGVVARVRHDVGDVVKAGDLLAELDNPEAVAEVRLAEAELALAAATQKEFLAAKGGKVDSSPAKEQLARLEAQVKVAEARLDLAKVRADGRNVRSPVDGIVGLRFTDVGNFVRKGETDLFTVLDVSRLRAVATVPELDVAGVREKQPCTVRVDALPDLVFVGRVERIEPVHDLAARRSDPLGRPRDPRPVKAEYRVFVTLVPTKDLEKFRLLPGMTVQVGFGKGE